jgi:hypothetical protein
LREPVQSTPFEHFPVEVDANGLVLVITHNPFTGGICGTAEILAQKNSRTLPQLNPGPFNKINLGFDILYRTFIKPVAVSRLRHGTRVFRTR